MAIAKCQWLLLGRGIIAIHPPLVFFCFTVLQNSGNPSEIRCFRRKDVCIIYVKIGSSVYRLNVKAREHILYKKAILRNEDGLN